VPVGFCGWIFPTKYKLAITMRTAKALRITVPPSQLARRDEVIE
jgi:putative tryptophan/tyrosine transport system substrate-binding protein